MESQFLAPRRGPYKKTTVKKAIPKQKRIDGTKVVHQRTLMNRIVPSQYAPRLILKQQQQQQMIKEKFTSAPALKKESYTTAYLRLRARKIPKSRPGPFKDTRSRNRAALRRPSPSSEYYEKLYG